MKHRITSGDPQMGGTKIRSWRALLAMAFSCTLTRASTHLVQKKASTYVPASYFVGKTGFEPATPWSQTRCATGLRYFPNKQHPTKQSSIACAPESYSGEGGIRTLGTALQPYDGLANR